MDTMQQTGVWDCDKLMETTMLPGLEETVILFHGDLGTWERIENAQTRRALEETPQRRLQFIVFIPGLFHVKMACADAIWRIFLAKKQSHTDKTSMFSFIRCKDGLSPGFPAAPERDVYDHSALPVFPRSFRTFRIRFLKVPAEGKLRQVCRSFVSLIHMFPCCFLVRIWCLDLGFMFLVCLLTSSLGLRRFYVLDLVISPAAGSRHPHVCSMVK